MSFPVARTDVVASTAPLIKIFDSVSSDIASPRILSAAQTPSLASPPPSPFVPMPAGSSDVRVLLVEDDPISMRILSRVCQREGVETVEAVDGLQAVELFVSFRPHLVLTDVNLCVERGRLAELIVLDRDRTVC